MNLSTILYLMVLLDPTNPSSSLDDWLEVWLSVNPLGEEGMTKLIRSLYARSGLHDISGHDLRRTFATMIREASHDEFLAMRLLRDKIPGQSERYLAVIPAMLREALEQYSPLRLIKNVSPAGETGECLVETGES